MPPLIISRGYGLTVNDTVLTESNGNKRRNLRYLRPVDINREWSTTTPFINDNYDNYEFEQCYKRPRLSSLGIHLENRARKEQKKVARVPYDVRTPQDMVDYMYDKPPTDEQLRAWDESYPSPPAEDWGVPTHRIPLLTVSEYVAGLRTASTLTGGVFKWPSDMYTFQRHFEVALHHLVPYQAISLYNGYAVPKDHNTVMWHGTGPENLYGIFQDGLVATYGSGSDAVGDSFFTQPSQGVDGTGNRRIEVSSAPEDSLDISVPGVYASQDFLTAASYPMQARARAKGWVRRNNETSNDAWDGTLIAKDGTLPMR
jgi:hypothetical protein